MTRIKVKTLLWDDWNTEHIKKHGVLIREVEEAGSNIIYHRKTEMKQKNNYMLYPSKADGGIPGFHSYEEEANFWDTHNITDFEDETEDVDIVFELRKPREEALVLRVQKNLKLAIEKIARRNALNPSALMRMWLTEKVNETLHGRKNISAPFAR